MKQDTLKFLESEKENFDSFLEELISGDIPQDVRPEKPPIDDVEQDDQEYLDNI